MPRIQILELPEGVNDERPPFALIIDQANAAEANQLRASLTGDSDAADSLRARTILVFTDTISIPANDIPITYQVSHDSDELTTVIEERDEARNWARHGYEIGQRHCSWSDYGVAPSWLTEGWPSHFDSCEHLKQAAAYDTSLSRVRSLPEQPETGDSNNPYSGDYLRGYAAAIKDAKRAANPQPDADTAPSRV